jgi:argininosuccinate lyase
MDSTRRYGHATSAKHRAASGGRAGRSRAPGQSRARRGTRGGRVTTWAGRVEGALDPDVWRFLKVDDAELLPYDCEATAAHARRLAAAGFLTDEELDEAESRLAEIAQDPESYLDSDEDVHSAIERLLGDVGRKIHAGRSRNDQVAAAFRAYVLDSCAEAREAIDALALVVLSFAESEAETVMPGYTHMQRAQPVTLGHHLLAWVEMLDRDRTRYAAAAEAASESPLGAGALAGSTLELPSPPRQMRNSMDAVADRDFALDYLYAAAVLFTHLSRFGEEIVLWATSEFGFVRLPETAATGSSMMPQKLNPDVAELVRGKAGTAIGRLTGLMATVKGLPLAYDRDLQEDKGPVFSTRRETRLALEALTVLVSGLEVDRARLKKAASDPLLLATDAAETLVIEGVPFRDAHEQIAESVRDGSYAKPRKRAKRAAPGPGGIKKALAEARRRFVDNL